MCELASKSRQRECVVFEMARESVSSRRSSITERASSYCVSYLSMMAEVFTSANIVIIKVIIFVIIIFTLINV